MNRDTWTRTEDRETLLVTDFITLEKHSPVLKVRTLVKNTIKDHRLRVLFPTSRISDKSFADTPFALVEREIHIPEETALWQERINEEKAFTSWCGVADTEGGLAVLSPWGLHEYSVMDDADRTLALTLFRSFFKTVFQAAETEGELQQDLVIEYQLLPFADAFNPIQAGKLVAAAQAGIRTHTTAALPDIRSQFTVEGEVLLTALKPADDGSGAIVRLWNPGATLQIARLHFAKRPKAVKLSNLREDAGDLIPLPESGIIAAEVPAGGLCTLKCFW
jgi:alpha-mannosidase